jgi:Domain of unknown function (DUF4124)
MKFIRTALPYLVASLGLVFSASAMAQYMWLDASGRKVFSDQPPPANVPAKRILQQPGKAAASTPAASADDKPNADADADSTKTGTKPKSPASTQPNASKDKDLEAAKKKIDDEAAAKKKADQEKMDEAKADNCKRAKQAKSTFDSGIRLNHTNAKGERGIMDEATRMVETKRVEGIIAADCK